MPGLRQRSIRKKSLVRFPQEGRKIHYGTIGWRKGSRRGSSGGRIHPCSIHPTTDEVAGARSAMLPLNALWTAASPKGSLTMTCSLDYVMLNRNSKALRAEFA